MDQRLLDYLLHLLSPEERQHVEAELRRSPAARARLARLRRRLAPLAADAAWPPAPPAGLASRTVAAVAAVAARRRLPDAPPVRSSPGQGWLRRADVLVAAAVLLVGGLFVGPLLARQWRRADVTACQHNLATAWTKLQTQDRPAGAYAPTELPATLLTDYGCPVHQRGATTQGPAPAYLVLGTSRLDEDRPLLADPPSPYGHDGGRNVLFAGGNVRFCSCDPTDHSDVLSFGPRRSLIAP
jgi:prepilin-type processing-associated H-X9-DG protein